MKHPLTEPLSTLNKFSQKLPELLSFASRDLECEDIQFLSENGLVQLFEFSFRHAQIRLTFLWQSFIHSRFIFVLSVVNGTFLGIGIVGCAQKGVKSRVLVFSVGFSSFSRFGKEPSSKLFQKSYPVAVWGNRTHFVFLLTALAISIKNADIAYGYILFNVYDISPSDPELIEALSSVWNVLCGKEKTLLNETRKFGSEC